MFDASRLVVLVDGFSYLFRAFNSLRDFATKDGRPTGAITGVMRMLDKIYENCRPEYFAVVFDAKGKNFRHEIFPEYKANRPPMDEDLAVQIEPLQELIRAVGYPVIIRQGVEADDVLGTLAKQALRENYQVLISSGDKDLAQLLVNADISLIDTMKNQAVTADKVAERFKVDSLRAEQVIDFLALVGDTVDNIPGVPGVGPKTAAKWLAEYQTLDAIMENASRITGKVGDSLRASLPQLSLSRQLATINCDLDLGISLSDLAVNHVNQEKLERICREFELKTIWNKHGQTDLLSSVENKKQAEKNYRVIENLSELKALVEKIKDKKRFAVAVMTETSHYISSKIIGIAIALRAGECFYLPLRQQLTANLPIAESLLVLQEIFNDEKIQKITADGKNLRHALKREGLEINNLEDVSLMSYCLNSTACRQNIAAIADFYLSYKTKNDEEVFGKGAKKITFCELDCERACEYLSEIADVSLQLFDFFSVKLAQTPELLALYRDLELPLSDVLFRMEEEGVFISREKLQEQSQELAVELEEIKNHAFDLAGEEFNLDSPKQLREIFFEKFKLPITKKTPKGEASTDEEVLEELGKNSLLPREILRHRFLSKLKNTYTDALFALIYPQTGRVHSLFNQAVTSTGRLSSSEPNLQNIPARSEEGRRIRRAFLAGENKKIIAADYSQIELRVMAHLSQDNGLCAAFERGEDIHTATACEIFGLKPEECDANIRRRAKSINFGLIYAMSAFGLAKQLGISRTEAQEYVDLYFSRYPLVREFMEEKRRQARENGFVSTIFSRRIHTKDITSRDARRRSEAERIAVNAPVQGSAADIIKKAMLDIDREIAASTDCRMIMQVHDELVFEVNADRAEQYREIIREKMQNAVRLNVPLIVDTKIADNWEEAH
ncbi:MAG: DNA polymerase I [Cardiobacteriaceae bacterium]|nr:DNA polymerase I [Cardiobacteriaceae bacterium]